MPIQKYLSLVVVIFVGSSVMAQQSRLDELLEREKVNFKKRIELADRRLEEAKKLHNKALQFASDRLIQSYEAAIKRTTQRGLLELANQLLAEKKKLQEGGGEIELATRLPNRVKWVDRIDMRMRSALYLGPFSNGKVPPAAEMLELMSTAKAGQTYHGKILQPMSAGASGTFTRLSFYNTYWFQFYVELDSPQTLEFKINGHATTGNLFMNKKKIPVNAKVKFPRGSHLILASFENNKGGGGASAFSLEINGVKVKEGIPQVKR